MKKSSFLIHTWAAAVVWSTVRTGDLELPARVGLHDDGKGDV